MRLRIILAGDFNTINCNLERDNPDLIDSNHISQKENQKIILEWSDKLKLYDPYRLFYPEKTAYTWQSFAKTGPKKRLDFFLISENITSYLIDCEIHPGTLNQNFDHNLIYCKFGTKRIKPDFFTIYNNTVCDPLSEFIFKRTYLDVFLHASNQNLPDCELLIGNMNEFIHNTKIQCINRLRKGETDFSFIKNSVDSFWNQSHTPYPRIEYINLLTIGTEFDVFFETLIGSIRNDLYTHQLFLASCRKLS